MSLQRRHFTALAASAAATPLLLGEAVAQTRKDQVTLGMVLEPTGLDPTTGAAAAIGEIVHYNILEGLTRIGVDGAVTPLLAQDWSSDPDGKVYAFRLRPGVKFSDGTVMDSAAVRFSFERAKAEGSTNKAKRAVFDNISSIATPSADTVILTLNNADGTLPFRLGENTAVILSPKSAASTNTNPVGTGPFKLENWAKGSAVTLSRWDGYRDAAKIKLRRASFRFINDPAAQVAALLAGDIDGMPRFGAVQNLKQFQADKRFTVEMGSTAGKGIMTINNQRKPLDDVRVRRALAHAIDRKAFIDGVLEGLGRPIGSHAAPTDLGYVDLTGMYAFDPDKSRALLREAGITTPLNLTLTLPPPQYARKGGEVIAAMLAKVGINAKLENVEWAQWLGGTFKGNFDLTIINHVEPLDFIQYANPQYYWGYRNPAFNALVQRMAEAPKGPQRVKLYGDIQRQLATDCANVFIFNPAQVAVSRRGLKGLWASSPIFANDLTSVSWA
ncbi:MAG: ABC transporter substrate-binding protein [Aquabacterium sp.]